MSLEELNELTSAQRLHAKEWGEVRGKENVESGHLESISTLGGISQGKKNAEGHIQSIQAKYGGMGGRKSQEEVNVCEHCTRTIKSKVYYASHGDKCSFKGLDIHEIYNKWKSGVQKKVLMEEYNIKRVALYNQLEYMDK